MVDGESKGHSHLALAVAGLRERGVRSNADPASHSVSDSTRFSSTQLHLW